ncbi:glycosyltransferase [Palleniella muris]|uniref:Glycosyltransferase n=1 Tax=Palleniella muris TaxID=3038145 RepID=A0AC61QR30_9BACT|nr:glycosyltransferase [Palleniella muris]TGX82465.1 glycosyltransferase [Palleniella muris]
MKKNILICLSCKLVPTCGGTERTTLLLAKELHEKHDCNCFLLTLEEGSEHFGCFKKQYEISYSNHTQNDIYDIIRDILADNHIDVCIMQYTMSLPKIISNILRKEKLTVKTIFAHHMQPGWEQTVSYQTVYTKYKNSRSAFSRIRYRSKLCLLPLFISLDLKRTRRLYRNIINNSDIIVLLSKEYIPLFQKIAKKKAAHKFRFIPNALTFNEFFDINHYDDKKKEVIIVSRLDERQKRILIALALWKTIKESPIAAEWTLKIIGDGTKATDIDKYRQHVASNSIPDVTFTGRTNPQPYYEEASIFMMTSKSEGLPMTLNEAHQMGVVPVVFDTFAALKDQVTDGYDGFVIEDNDKESFVSIMLELMSDGRMRLGMAENSIESSKKFQMDRIINRWTELID